MSAETLRFVDRLRHRLLPSAERGATSLWPWPLAAGATAVLAALLLARWGPDQDSWVGRLAWPGDQEAGRVMLQVVVASVMTATSVTFSLVVVALQVASQQFSPRLLRGFARDRVLKGVLAVLVATFAFSITLLRDTGDRDGLPALALLVTYLSALASLASLLAFISHMASSLRVDTMMVSVHADTSRAISHFYQPWDDASLQPSFDPPADAVTVPSLRSGFIKLVDVPALLDHATQARVSFWLSVRPGDHVVRGTPTALAWSRHGAVDAQAAADLVDRSIELGYERTLEQDPSYGFRKLTDIAVKALSPGINDPVTAIHAVGHCADLLVVLTGRRLGPHSHTAEGGSDGDGDDTVVVTVDRDLRYYLDLTCGQIRRYGSHEPTVLVALLRMLRDVAVSSRTDEQRHELRRQVELVLAVVPDDLPADDIEQVHDLAARVEHALRGEVLQAYQDRSGETRSV